MKEIVINLENSDQEEYKDYSIRDTVRVILLDNQNRIGVINISKEGYYQLIGGGIEDGESKKEALLREIMEESGVNEIENLSELVKVVEIKKVKRQIQNSFCYVAKIKGKKGDSNFTNDEVEKRGFKTEWWKIDELIDMFKMAGYGSLIGQYSYERDMLILREYKNYLK